MTGDPLLKTINLLADNNCWNCKYCTDLQLTEFEIDDFCCDRDSNFRKLDEDLICEWWEYD